MPKDIDTLLPKVLRHAPNCPEPRAIQALRDVAIEFCKRTRLWNDHDEFTVTSPESEGICSIPDADIFEVTSARFTDAYQLTPRTRAWLDAKYPGWQQDTDTATPRFVTQLQPGTVTIYPRATGKLWIGLTLVPSQDATTLPDFLANLHGTMLGAGAAGSVLMDPGEDWTNPNLGVLLSQGFEQKLDTEAARAAKTQVKARLRTRPRFF